MDCIPFPCLDLSFDEVLASETAGEGSGTLINIHEWKYYDHTNYHSV